MSLGDLLDILAILMSFLVALVGPKAKRIEPFSMSPNIFLLCFPMTLNAIHGLKNSKTFLTIVPPMSPMYFCVPLMSSNIIFGILNVLWCPFLPQKNPLKPTLHPQGVFNVFFLYAFIIACNNFTIPC